MSLSRSEYWDLTERLMVQFRQINWAQFKTVHLFMPISRHREVDTFSILSYFKEEHPELSIGLPKTNFSDKTMSTVLFDHEYTILTRNSFDIPEPLYGTQIDPGQIDVVFMPLLAYDLSGNRVGYGKGFYDRFLTSCRNDVRKVGLSYFGPVVQISDVSELDIKMDMCICPEQIWEFPVSRSSATL